MSAELNVVYLGDIVATSGRQAVQAFVGPYRAAHRPDLVIANAENARAGSGLSLELYTKLHESGIDAMTLGDHAYRYDKVNALFERSDAMVCRPANLSRELPGKPYLRVPLPDDPSRSLFIIIVLGQVFMDYPCDSPFRTVDAILAQLPERNPLVIVEAHMEATSEKAALAHYLDGRVAAVLGSHTHVPTADARVLPKGTAFITDLGMCGPVDSVIGREIPDVVRYLSTGQATRFNIAQGPSVVSGVALTLDRARGVARSIERVEVPAVEVGRR